MTQKLIIPVEDLRTFEFILFQAVLVNSQTWRALNMGKTMSKYFINAINYLDRANKVFDLDYKDTWFYAAFEIRCGVEARMREYLEHQKGVSAKMKQGWKPAGLAKNIEKVFKCGEKEAHFSFHAEDADSLTLVYRPVPLELRKAAEKLGNYLHATRKGFFEKQDYWDAFQKLLERGLELLEYSLNSELLGVPMRNVQTNQLEIFAAVTSEVREQLNDLLTKDRLATIEVNYVEINLLENAVSNVV